MDPNDLTFKMLSLCKQGEAEQLRSLLTESRSDLDLDAPVNNDGWTCLHEIIPHECQFTDVARVLLAFGASPNTRDLGNGDTPLHAALLYHSADNVRLLLDHGADASVLNEAGRAAVHAADDAECMRVLITHRGELVNVVDSEGNTALHYAATAGDGGELLSVISDLVADVVKPNAKNRTGATALHVAAADASAVAALLRLGADPNESDVDGNTPLHLAVKGRHKESVQTMVASGADPKKLSRARKSPLGLATTKEIKSALLQLGGQNSSSPSVSSSAKTTKGVKRRASSALVSAVGQASLPECSSPSILKRRAAPDSDEEGISPAAKRHKSLRFSEVTTTECSQPTVSAPDQTSARVDGSRSSGRRSTISRGADYLNSTI